MCWPSSKPKPIITWAMCGIGPDRGEQVNRRKLVEAVAARLPPRGEVGVCPPVEIAHVGQGNDMLPCTSDVTPCATSTAQTPVVRRAQGGVPAECNGSGHNRPRARPAAPCAVPRAAPARQPGQRRARASTTRDGAAKLKPKRHGQQGKAGQDDDQPAESRTQPPAALGAVGPALHCLDHPTPPHRSARQAAMFGSGPLRYPHHAPMQPRRGRDHSAATRRGFSICFR